LPLIPEIPQVTLLPHLRGAAVAAVRTAQPVQDKMIKKERLIKLARDLIRIDSQNPPGDEYRIDVFVRDYLQGLGLEARIHEFKKKRSNVIAVLKAKNRKRSLLITPHLDTVPGGRHWHFKPLGAEVHNRKIYGLGATDCKGNLAAAIESINSIVEEGISLGYNLIFAATADEETGSGFGLLPLLAKRILRPDVAVVLDADNFHIVVAQKGLIHLKVKIKGRRAHGAYPWLGENAIDVALKILQEIKRYRPGSIKNKYLRPPTVNIGTIHGGDKVNVVADWCEFELDFRFLPGMSAKNILKDLKTIIRRHTRKSKVEVQGIQQPYVIDTAHPLIGHLCRAIKRSGIQPVIKGSEGATAISFFDERGIAAVATGFGCAGCAHSADEYVRIADLYRGALALEDFLKNYKFS